MTAPADSRWVFAKRDPDNNIISGHFAKSFRSSQVKTPAIFDVAKPSGDAALLMREVTQNAWDSALEMRAELKKNGDTPPPQFTLTYKFAEVVGKDKTAVVNALGLRQLRDRLKTMEAEQGPDVRRELGLPTQDDCLDHLSSRTPLHLLQISEAGSGGMFGNWGEVTSKLHHALCSFGITKKPDGSGGSYGYGKAGLIRGSRIRTVVAYTCFRERTTGEYSEPGITRRLLGCVYWGDHTYEGTWTPGDARLGNGRKPLENDAADAMATTLGLEVRNPDTPGDLGTTILLVDPTVEPRDLRKAAERYWWPALEAKGLKFDIDIIGATGTKHKPQPRKHSWGKRQGDKGHDLSAFLSTYETALDRSTSRFTRGHWPIHVEGASARVGNPYGIAGQLCLTHDLEDWTYPARREDGMVDASLVALVREPRMVVEYYVYGRNRPPYVRGTFVADSSVNEALALTEPPPHDEWSIDGLENDVAPKYTELSSQIIGRIRDRIQAYRKPLTAVPDEPDELQLPAFEELAKLLQAGGPTRRRASTTRAKPRALSIIPGDEMVFTPEGRYVHGVAKISYSDDPSVTADLRDELAIRVSVSYTWERFDNRLESSRAAVVLEPPEGFRRIADDQCEGVLVRGDVLEVEYITDEYSQPWTGSIFVAAEVLDASAAATATPTL